MVLRLGDYIDDHCSHCKRIMDHAVVTMAGEEVLRVRCRTCNYEHKYRKAKSGRKEMTKAEAFQKVLASVIGEPAAAAPVPEPKKKRSRR